MKRHSSGVRQLWADRLTHLRGAHPLRRLQGCEEQPPPCACAAGRPHVLYLVAELEAAIALRRAA